jgi:hypothetical protein
MSKNIIVFLFLIVILLVIPIKDGFCVEDYKEKQIFFFISTKQRQIVIGWRHSVELQPWMETYKVVEDGKLLLLETNIKAYGAGVPDSEGKVKRLKNEFLTIRGIHRKLDRYILFHSDHSRYFLKVGEQKYLLKRYVPFDESVSIYYKKISFGYYLYLLIIGKIK